MLLIRNAKLFTMDGADRLSGADLLMENGKIKAVGENLSAPGAKVIDAAGLYALPGVVDAHCHIGMWEDSMGFEGADGNEATDPSTPHLRAIDAINAEDRCFEEARAHGVTTVATGPGSANVIGGQFLAMKTAGRYVDDMVIQTPLALKIAFGENPKGCYGRNGKMPQTRMATAAILREQLVAAQDYAQKRALEDADKRPARDLRKDALADVLSGKLLVKAHAHRADDILTALRIRDEFGLRMSLEHCTEGYRILDKLAAAQVPVVLGPLLADRSKIELRNLTIAAPAHFARAGVPFALMTDHPVIPIHYLLVQAALCVREGLDEYEALKSVTVNAARAIGLDARIGTLSAGKDADFALYDGHPLDARSHVKLCCVNGEIVHEA